MKNEDISSEEERWESYNRARDFMNANVGTPKVAEAPCPKCNGQWKCSKHFIKHPCCGSTDYNRHNHSCRNND